MDVAAYIRELLNSEHFVYVPGLGTFLTRRTAGVYHQQQQRFYPPKNEVDFVAEEKEDETLENFISKEKNISTQAAKYFIDRFVDQLKTNSETKNIPVKEALFPTRASLENTDFQENVVFDQENFGLQPIFIPQINLQTAKTAEDAEPTTDYVENFYRDFSGNLPEETVAKKRNGGFWGALILLLAICLLGCYALYLYYPDIYGQFIPVKRNQPAVLQPAIVDSVAQTPATPIDTITKNTAPDSLAATVKKTVIDKKPVPEETPVNDPNLVDKSPYEIIGAAFKTLKGAKAFVGQLGAKGMQAKILKGTAGRPILVTFGSFNDKEPAKAALEKLRARDVHSEAYIQHYINK